MSDLSIAIKIAGKLEKSFSDAIRAAQSGLASLNAAVSKEMAEAGQVSAAASREMATAGKMCAAASKEMAAAGRAGATASRGIAAEGKAAAASSRAVAAAGDDAAATFLHMAGEGMKAAAAVKDIASTGRVTARSVRDITSAVKGVVKGFKDMSTQGKKASKDLQAGGKEAVSLSKDLAAGGKGTVSLSKDLAGIGEMAGTAAKGFSVAGAAATAAVAVVAAAGKVIVEVGKYSVQVGMEFETAMSDAAATANASAEEFDKMEQAAMEMGKTTSKTASESAKALEYMSLAGWDVDTSISALPSVLKMSEATGMELGRTSDLVTDSMAALGVTVDELPGYLDVAAKAQTKSNQSAEQLMEAYLGVGGTMKNLNVPVEESATALGVLANRGIKGSEAGTALNAIMVNLTTGTGQAGKMMQQLGVSAFDQQGKFIGMEATLQQLNTALQGCSEEQRNAAMAAIGGKQHIDALNDLMAGLNTTNEEGISEWAALRGELDDCNGSLDAMRDKKLDNLKGDLAALESATQDVGIKIYEHMNGPMRDFAQFGTQAVQQVSGALESDGFAGMAGAAGSALAGGFGKVAEHLPEFLATAATSIVTFLIGFISDLPSSLLAGLIKGIPRLLKVLPQLGVSLAKALIKGLLSSLVGIVPKVIGKLLFGGGKDKADAEKAGAEAAKGYAAGADGNAEAEADAPSGPGDAAAIAEAGATGGGALKADAGQAGAGIPLEDALPKEGQEGPKEDAPAIADAAPTLQAAADTGMGVMDMAGPDARSGEFTAMGQDETGEGTIPADALPVSADTLEPVQSADMAATTDMPPIETAGDDTVGGDALPPVGAVRAEVGDAGDVPEGAVQATSAAASDIPPGDMQAPTDIPLDIPPEAVQTETDAVTDMPQGSIQAVADAASDTPQEDVQVPAEVVADTSTGMGQPFDAAQTGAGMDGAGDAVQPDDASAISGLSGIGMAQTAMAVRDTADSGVATDTASPPAEAAQIPPGAEAPGTGEGTAQAGDALQAGIANVPGPGLAGAASSGKMGLASAAGGPDMMDGIGQDVAGIVNASPAGAIMAGIEGESAAAGAQDASQGADGAAAVSPETVPPAGALAGPEQPPAESMEGISPKARETVGVAQAEPGLPGPGRPGPEGPEQGQDRPGKGMRIGDALGKLAGGSPAAGAPAPGGTPSVTINLTVNVEGNGDVKEEVAEGVRIGAREFDKLMQGWMRQNKRGAFGKVAAWI